MAKLIYSAITSLDGYIEDAEGKFDWAEHSRPELDTHSRNRALHRAARRGQRRPRRHISRR
jgi:hypothetical protein